MDTLILKQCRLFRDLPPETLEEAVLPKGRVRSFAKRAVLIAPGDRVDWFAVVLQGKVQISQIFADGTSSLMDALGPGHTLGTDLLCTRSRRSPYYAVAAGDVRIFQFPGALLLEPEALPGGLVLWRNLLTILSDGSLRKHYRLAILAQRGLRDRILIYLTMQAERRGTTTFRIPFSREELAAFLCVNRSALSHELSRMEAEGLIRFRKNAFTLLAAGERRSTWSGME